MSLCETKMSHSKICDFELRLSLCNMISVKNSYCKNATKLCLWFLCAYTCVCVEGQRERRIDKEKK